jgi:hypothetical protein
VDSDSRAFSVKLVRSCEITGNFHRSNIFFEKFCQRERYRGNGVGGLLTAETPGASTCVEAIHPVHQAQLLSYLRLSKKNVGLLINFHVAHLKDGIKRMVDGWNWER